MHNTRFAKAASFGTLMLAMIAHPLLAQVEPAASTELYAQTTAALSSTVSGFVNIPGLAITLPAATATGKFAIITLNAPNLYMTGGVAGETMGAAVAIMQNGGLAAIGQISTDVVVGAPGAALNGRKPVTVVLKVALGSSPISITGAWATTSGATVNTDSFSSLSALLTTK